MVVGSDNGDCGRWMIILANVRKVLRKSALQGTQSTAQSALQGPQSIPPATKSAAQGPRSTAPATKSALFKAHEVSPNLKRQGLSKRSVK